MCVPVCVLKCEHTHLQKLDQGVRFTEAKVT